MVITILVPAAWIARDDALDLARRAPGRGSRSARRGTAPRAAAPRRARARGAAARRRRARAPGGRARCASPTSLERLVRARRSRSRAATPASFERVGDVARAPSGAASPGAGTPSPARRGRRRVRRSTRSCPTVGREQAVAQAQQHALAGAVGAEDHRARPALDLERDAVDDARARRRETTPRASQRQNGASARISRSGAAPLP